MARRWGGGGWSSELGFWARKRHGSEVGSKECGDPKECGGEKGRRKEDERREERIESSSNRQGLVPTVYDMARFGLHHVPKSSRTGKRVKDSSPRRFLFAPYSNKVGVRVTPNF